MPFNLVRVLRSPDEVPGGGGEPMIPKYRFDEVNQKLKESEAKVSDLTTQLETATKESSAKDEKLSALEKELADTKASYEKEKSDAKRMEAIKASLGEGVQDIDVMLKLIDMDKITFGEDGKLSGLDEQVSELKTSKPFLFKAPPAPVKPNKKPGEVKEKSFAKTLAEKKTGQVEVSKASNNYFG